MFLTWVFPSLLLFRSHAKLGEGRPHPAMVHAAMRAAGVDDPRECLKVGDTATDVAEGLAAHPLGGEKAGAARRGRGELWCSGHAKSTKSKSSLIYLRDHSTKIYCGSII